MDSSDKKNILVVDDEEGIRSVMEANLQRFGYSVLLAGNGLHAIQKMKSEARIDLVICDLKMPGLSGIEVLKAMKKEIGKNIPFLIVTGFADKAKIIEAVNEGVNYVMVKPVKMQVLIEKIQYYLSDTSEVKSA